MGVLKTWEVGEIKGNPQSQSKKGLKVEVKKKGGTTQCLLSPNHFKYVKM